MPQHNPTRASSRQPEPPGVAVQTLLLALLLGLALRHAVPPAFAEAPPASPRFLWQAVDATTDTTAVYTLTTNGSQVFTAIPPPRGLRSLGLSPPTPPPPARSVGRTPSTKAQRAHLPARSPSSSPPPVISYHVEPSPQG